MTANMEMSYASTNPEITPRTSGDFLSRERRNPVVTPYDEFLSGSKPVYDRHGIKVSRGFVDLADGISLEIAYSEIDQRRRRTPEGLLGMAAYQSTAWLTQPDGMYIRELLSNAKTGVEGTVIGSPSTRGQQFNPTDNGRNMLEIARWQAPLLGRDETQILLRGVSQGFHNGLAAHAQADEFGFDVVRSELRAGCLVDGITPEMVLEAPFKIANEFIYAGNILKTPMRALVHYAKTLDATMRGTYTHAQALGGLLSGQAGQHMRNLPESTFAHFSAAGGDFMGDSRRVKAIAARYPFVSVSTNGKSHLDDAAGHDKFEEVRARDKTFSDVMIENPQLRSMPIDLMRKHLYHLACEQNPTFASGS